MRCVQYSDYSHDIGMHAGQVVVVISRLHGSRSRSRSGSGTRRFVRDLAEELTPLVLDGGVLIQVERQRLGLGYFGLPIAGSSGVCALGASFHCGKIECSFVFWLDESFILFLQPADTHNCSPTPDHSPFHVHYYCYCCCWCCFGHWPSIPIRNLHWAQWSLQKRGVAPPHDNRNVRRPHLSPKSQPSVQRRRLLSRSEWEQLVRGRGEERRRFRWVVGMSTHC